MSKRTRLLFLASVLVSFFGTLAAPQAAHAQAAAAITEITVEHTRCFGTCPVYKVILRRDGTATFIGTDYVGKLGTYTAYFAGFNRLVSAIQARHFAQFKPVYTRPITDNPGVETSIVSGGHRKSVYNYADSGPQPLWEIQSMIDGTVAEMQWKKVSSSTKFRERKS